MASVLGTLFGGGVGEVAKPIEAVGNVIDNLFTSDDERLSHEEIKMRIAQKPGLVQAEINKIEAQHRSVFVAGWRPGIGWVCAVSLAAYYVPQYTLAAVLWTRASWEAAALQPYPVTADGLLELVLALLGMATVRTIEKLNGRAK